MLIKYDYKTTIVLNDYNKQEQAWLRQETSYADSTYLDLLFWTHVINYSSSKSFTEVAKIYHLVTDIIVLMF